MTSRRLFWSLPLFFLVPAAHTADVTYIPARDYAAVAEKEIDAAKSSIRLYLYIFNYRAAQPQSLPARLAQALARAKTRGVHVEVTLDPGDGVWQNGGAGSQNAEAVQFLRETGAAVFLSSGPVLHAKALVLDDTAVLLGSTNWSMAAFTANAETNVLIRSSAAAHVLLRDLQTLPRRPPPEPPADFPVPEAFISPELLGRMVNRDDHRAVTAYLFIRGHVGTSPLPFALDGDAMIRALDLPGLSRGGDRQEIRVVLKRLQDRYQLVDFMGDQGADFLVRVKELPGGAVSVPRSYALYGWDRRLSLSGKVFILLSLRESAASPISPRWSLNQRTLMRRYGVSRQVLQHGIMELRRAGLLDVEYAPLAADAPVHVRPSVYTPRPFYDPAVLEARLQSLARTHGSDALSRAQKIAALLYEDSDINAIEQFIQLEAQHGLPAIEQAAAILGAKDPANPKRTVGYFINTVKGLAREAGRDSTVPVAAP